jgi:hypothetical protein
MTLDVSKKVLNIEGDVYKAQDKDLTIGMVIGYALATVKSSDPLKSYVLAGKTYGKESVDVTPEEIVFIKAQLIGAGNQSMYFPYIIGQVQQELDKA